MADCLHCAINELIDEHVKNGPQPIDLAELASMIAQSLGEFILAAPQQHQAALMADCLATLGQTILEKPDDEGRSKAH
jgi:predicted house-cleaning NTP pyrophosphatase (Maf/HAM1 superfamily)